jgi:hypothetical protein
VDGEAAQALGSLGLDLDACYVGIRGALMTPPDQLVHGLGLSFGDDFDPPVGQVARPARDTKGARLVSAGAPVPDTLDPPAYPEVAADHTIGQASPGRPTPDVPPSM